MSKVNEHLLSFSTERLGPYRYLKADPTVSGEPDDSLRFPSLRR